MEHPIAIRKLIPSNKSNIAKKSISNASQSYGFDIHLPQHDKLFLS